MGKKELPDLVLKNINLINVFTGEIYATDVAITGEKITGIGSYEGTKEIDLTNKYLCPGLIDGHIHLESSMLSPYQFSKAVVPRGTTTIIADPHEIANVCGKKGIDYIIEGSKEIPLDIYIMLPSCVPATPNELAGATLIAEDLMPYYDNKQVLGLGEMMNFPGVLASDQSVWDKLYDAHKLQKIIDGHAPGLTGKELSAYVAAGITSDHECTTKEEALERLRLGQRIMIREGTGSKNIGDLLPIITQAYSRRLMLVADDKHPEDLIENGHLDFSIKKLIKKGINPVMAIQMASLNHAEYFGLKNRGAIAPGYLADFLILSSLNGFEIEEVYKNGQLVAKNGEALFVGKEVENPSVQKTFQMPEITEDMIQLKGQGTKARVIGVIPKQIITKELIIDIKNENGEFKPSIEQDILKLVVAERHHNTGKIGIGLVHGFGLKKGAIASSISHDSHNLIIVGTNDKDICLAANTVRDSHGGLAITKDGSLLESLPLPIAGLMTSDDINNVITKISLLKKLAKELGIYDDIDPFMLLSFLALPVIPELKLTPKGIIRVLDQKKLPVIC